MAANEVLPDNKKRRAIIAAGIVVAAVLVAVGIFFALRPHGTSPTADTGSRANPRASEAIREAKEADKPLERPKSGPLAKGEIRIVNAEELYVRLLDEGLGKAYDKDPENLSIELRVAATDGTKELWTKTYNGADLKKSGAWTADGNEVGLVLDSLRKGGNFGQMVSDDDQSISSVVDPGDDMQLYVRAVYGDGAIDNGDGEVVNTLYESVSEVDGKRCAHVSRLRHLLNLDSDRTSGDAYEAVLITDDIHFAGGYWDDADLVGPLGREDGHAPRPVDRIAPIKLLDTASKAGALVDGDGHMLYDLIVGNKDGTGDNVGTFAKAACEIRGITLVNPHVSGANNVGALVGQLTRGANLHDCVATIAPNANGAYVYDDYVVRGQRSVGGLVGKATDAKIGNCTSSLSVAGRESVGGLVGSVTGGRINASGTHAAFVSDAEQDSAPVVSALRFAGGLAGSVSGTKSVELCHAAVNVIPTDDDHAGSTTFGGLAGSVADGTEVVGCYASGLVRVGNAGGGLVGLSDASTIRTSFSTGDVRCNERGGGFVGAVSGEGVIQESRSYGLVTNADGTPVDSNGGFFGANDASWDNIDGSNAYLRERGYNEVNAADAVGEEGRSYGRGKSSYELVVEGGSVTQREKLHPYRVDLKGHAFPFEELTGIGEIWGDWPQQRTARWFNDLGELVLERQVPLGSDPEFDPSRTHAAERPQEYDADGPYYLVVGWDGHHEPNGDYTATAIVQELPFHELFDDEVAWTAALYERMEQYCDEDWKATEDYVIDSMEPNAPVNPEDFSYHVSAKKGETPIFIIGQKLPPFGEQAGRYRVLRFDEGENTLQCGFATAKDTIRDGEHFWAYDEFTEDNMESEV